MGGAYFPSKAYNKILKSFSVTTRLISTIIHMNILFSDGGEPIHVILASGVIQALMGL